MQAAGGAIRRRTGLAAGRSPARRRYPEILPGKRIDRRVDPAGIGTMAPVECGPIDLAAGHPGFGQPLQRGVIGDRRQVGRGPLARIDPPVPGVPGRTAAQPVIQLLRQLVFVGA